MDTAVGLVESYLRLNGYFTVTEFQIQHPVPGQPGKFETATDLDILAVHLPWAAETVLRHPQRVGESRCEILLVEDPALGIVPTRPDILIGEVKEGAAALNRRLETPEVLFAALRRVGCCPEEHIAQAAAALARTGEFNTDAGHGGACRIRVAAFCGRVDERGAPALLAVTLDHIVRFIQRRLHDYRDVLRGAHFKDGTLSLFQLIEKLGLGPAGHSA